MLCGFMALYNYKGPLAPGLNFVKTKFCQESQEFARTKFCQILSVFLFSVHFILRAALNC